MFRDCLTTLYTPDLPAAQRFYRDLPGFAPTFRSRPRASRSTSSCGSAAR